MTAPQGAEGDPSGGVGPVAAVGLGPETQRLDKWLWCARVVKTRTQASTLVSSGKVRVNRVKTDKPAHSLRIGDVVTASTGPRVRVLKVVALGLRRGPPTVARQLFEELTPARDAQDTPSKLVMGAAASSELSQSHAQRPQGAGRPTKKERRQIGRLKSS